MNFKSDFVRVTLEDREIGIFTESAYTYWLLNTSVVNKSHHKAAPMSYFKLKFSSFYYDLLKNHLVKVKQDELQYSNSIDFII